MSRYFTASRADVIVFSTFVLGIIVCFLLSASFHLFSNHSEMMRILGGQLDYLGIVILIWGSTIPYIYYGFACSPSLQRMYWAVVSVLASMCVVAVLDPGFRRPSHRLYRTLMFAGLGISFVVPILHGVLLFGWEVQRKRMSLDWVVVNMVCNGLGAVVYSTRVSTSIARIRVMAISLRAQTNVWFANRFLNASIRSDLISWVRAIKSCIA
jgi:adiponectin receptor